MRRLMIIALLAMGTVPALAAPADPPPAAAPKDDAQVREEMRQMRDEMRQMQAELQRLKSASPATPAGPSVPVAPTAPAAPVAPATPQVHSREVLMTSRDYTVQENEVVDGNVRVVRGDLDVLGTVNGDASTVSGDITVNGTVHGNVAAVRGDVSLGPHAVVDGDVQVVSRDLTRDPGSVVKGSIRNQVRGPKVSFESPGSEGRGLLKDALFEGPLNLPTTILLLVIGIVLLAVAPQRMDLIGRTFINRPVYSLMVGAASLPMMIVAIIVSIVTIVGPVVIAFAWIGALLMGITAMALMLGRRVAAGKPYRSRFYPLLVGLGVWFLVVMASHVASPLYVVASIGTSLAYLMAVGAALVTGCGASPDWLRDRLSRRASSFSYVDPSTTYAGKGDL